MKKFAIIATIGLMLLGFAGKASAQLLPDVPDMKGKIIYGGNFGGGIYGNNLDISIAPQVGYRIFSPWEVGVRGIYSLSCYFNSMSGNEYGHYFGVAPYTNVQVYKGLFLHAEDELMYGLSRWNHQTIVSQWFNSTFVGAGYRQYTSIRSFVYCMVLYNLTWGNGFSIGGLNTPYSTPISIRVGFCF